MKMWALEHRRSDNDDWQKTGTVYADKEIAQRHADKLNRRHGPREKYRVTVLEMR